MEEAGDAYWSEMDSLVSIMPSIQAILEIRRYHPNGSDNL